VPELPEVETIAASLRPKIVGRRIAEVRLLLPKLLRGDPGDLDRLRGRRIKSVRRRGKMLLVSCDGGVHLLFHLKMTGQFHWAARRAPVDAHTRLRIAFREPGPELRFRDVRKFAVLRILVTDRPLESAALRLLGPEPLEMGPAEFRRLLRRRKGRLKSLLLNQAFLAGIGNIYADEILFDARLHPLRPAGSLTAPEIRRLAASVRKILEGAVAAGGSSIRDYKDADGLDGLFQNAHRVYGRKGESCVRCGDAIRRRVIGGRSSFYCPRCQKGRTLNPKGDTVLCPPKRSKVSASLN
jgi:formamidopyrimidine-DNA glycosylase